MTGTQDVSQEVKTGSEKCNCAADLEKMLIVVHLKMTCLLIFFSTQWQEN